MQYLLFEDSSHFDLLPLCYTRPAYHLRVGITTLYEKWSHYLGGPVATLSTGYLRPHFDHYDPTLDTYAFNGKFIPNESLVQGLMDALEPGSYLMHTSGEIIAFRGKIEAFDALPDFDGTIGQEVLDAAGFKARPLEDDLPQAIRYPWDIFRLNGETIREDFLNLSSAQPNQGVQDPHTIVYGRDNIFVAPGAKIRAAVLNAEDGPIYIGPNCNIQEGAMVHGTHAFCEHVTLNMGAKLRGDTTVGPWSKVGGEIGNSVIQGYSNKGHDGYLGNSVLGHWCNLGADTNTSNLKNNYSEVRVWNYPDGRFRKTGQMFCGLIMGDHSKCGINTMFNTGTVIGVSANVYGGGYPRTFIPSFSWGGAAGFTTYQMRKAAEVAEVVMARRNTPLTQSERDILQSIFDQTASYRKWEKR